eukprot:9468386-Alexandrium_andersonii.AAC.1
MWGSLSDQIDTRWGTMLAMRVAWQLFTTPRWPGRACPARAPPTDGFRPRVAAACELGRCSVGRLVGRVGRGARSFANVVIVAGLPQRWETALE